MPHTRPLLALLAAISLLFGLTTADAGAHKRGKHQRHHTAKKQCKKLKKKQRKKQKRCQKRKRNRHRDHGSPPQNGSTGVGAPGATDDVDEETTTAIGTITAVDGDVVTVTLSQGGAVTARVTEDTDVICGEETDGEGGTGDDDVPGEDDMEDAEDDGGEQRQAAACAPAVGQPVYDLELDDTVAEPAFLWLDLAG